MPTIGSDPQPTAVSLFTGAGGLDLAGFRTVAAVECEEDRVATLRGTAAPGRRC